MNPLLFLAFAVALSLAGSLIVVTISAIARRRTDDAMTTFAKEMHALAPDEDLRRRTSSPPPVDAPQASVRITRPPED